MLEPWVASVTSPTESSVSWCENYLSEESLYAAFGQLSRRTLPQIAVENSPSHVGTSQTVQKRGSSPRSRLKPRTGHHHLPAHLRGLRALAQPRLRRTSENYCRLRHFPQGFDFSPL